MPSTFSLPSTVQSGQATTTHWLRLRAKPCQAAPAEATCSSNLHRLGTDVDRIPADWVIEPSAASEAIADEPAPHTNGGRRRAQGPRLKNEEEEDPRLAFAKAQRLEE